MPPHFGESVRRREDARLLTGRGNYVADTAPAGSAHAMLVRSPHAHADILSIDMTLAAAMPGVCAVLTARDAEADGIGAIPGGVAYPRPDGGHPKSMRPPLAGRRCRFAGEAVAMVVADTPQQARDAAEAVSVTYAAMDALATAEDASAAGAPDVWEEAPGNIGFVWQGGDATATAQAMQAAAHVTRLRLQVSRVTANPMEPRGCWAELQPDGRTSITVSHQNPHALRSSLGAGILASDPGRIRVQTGDVGGAFGMKDGIHVETILVGWAARRLGRPVCWISDRSEGFLSDEQGRDIGVEAALAMDADGIFIALQVSYDLNMGAYLTGRSLFPINNMGGLAGVYRTPHISAEVRGVFTNAVPNAAYRGAGRPEATYVIERLIDVAARELGITPLELRRRNLIPAEAMPFCTGLTFTYDSGDFAGNMQAATRAADLAGFPVRRAAAEARGKLRGIGLCNCIEASGGPFLGPFKDAAELRLNADGSVTLLAGAMSTGQGLETALPQLAAAALGMDVGQIRYLQGDTDQLPYGRGSGGSSGLFVGGSAVRLAGEKLIEIARMRAADALEAAEGDVVFADGRFEVAGTDRRIGWAEIAALGSIAAHAEYQPTGSTFPNGTHIAEVEIDLETGETTLVAYHAIEDLGRVLNPLLADGQIHGGIAQGAGQALGERIVHERATGQLLTGSFMDYQMPRAADFPDLVLATREVPTALNPLGVKGVGEAGTVGSLAAVMNAVCDALAPLGIRHFDMPATPGRVWAAITSRAGPAGG